MWIDSVGDIVFEGKLLESVGDIVLLEEVVRECGWHCFWEEVVRECEWHCFGEEVVNRLENVGDIVFERKWWEGVGKGPVMQTLGIFFVVCLSKLLDKESYCQWF